MSAVIKRCVCASPFQDKKYGKQMRVHAERGGKNIDRPPRCTVCGREN